MAKPKISPSGFKIELDLPDDLELTDGSQVAVIGGGPAGSFFSYHLLELAKLIGLDVQVDIFEPRDFARPAPVGCNMCGGIVSESLVQSLATDGINLTRSVVQRGINSYVLHMDVGTVRIETPMLEKRIAAVTRGSGPRDVKEMKWESFDGHLQKLAIEKGARVINTRVSAVEIVDGRPRVSTRLGTSKDYDLLVVATGVNSPLAKMFKDLDFGYQPPEATKTFICEYYIGGKEIKKVLGSSMHVFLLDIPRLDFAAIIPKGDYATVCMLGKDIDEGLIHSFLSSPEVTACMPPDWQISSRSCNCFPRINVKGAGNPYADRIVFIGDCGVTRLYKDGIGAAYRTAKAAASTAIFQGVAVQDFRKHFAPVCNNIRLDNFLGRMNFLVTTVIKKMRFTRRALLRMTTVEQDRERNARRMSTVLWDMFTGSAPYKEIFLRTLHPAFLTQFLWNMLLAFGYQISHPAQEDESSEALTT